MLKRRTILLASVLYASRAPSLPEFMRWLFLLKQESVLSRDRSFYDFVPYHHEPFSFTAHRDLQCLIRLGYVDPSTHKPRPDQLAEVRRECELIGSALLAEVERVIIDCERLSSKALKHHVRTKYPWSTGRDRSAKTAKGLADKVKTIFTIGYEGKSVDAFLSQLLSAPVERVLDVRSNAVSRKYGFSKKVLGEVCGKLGIGYRHLPQLGIPRSHRTSLNSFKDYQALMREYDRMILPRAAEAREEASRLLRERSSALLCFEADARCCHRGRLANSISSETGLAVVHL